MPRRADPLTRSDPGGQRQRQVPAQAGPASVCPSQALPPPHSTGPGPQAGLQTLELRVWLRNMFLRSVRHTGAAHTLAPCSPKITLGLSVWKGLSLGPPPDLSSGPTRGTSSHPSWSQLCHTSLGAACFFRSSVIRKLLFPSLFVTSSQSCTLVQLGPRLASQEAWVQPCLCH